jgi:cyclopropane fatty-acyl-phospholipid synthase-like methyltransferase
MPSAEAFPLYYPSNARRAFESDDITRRFATVATLSSGARVLEVLAGRGSASVLLAKEFGCEVVATDSDDTAISNLMERVRSLSIQDRVTVKRTDPTHPDFPPGEFDAIVVQGRVVGTLDWCTSTYRALLATNGRLMITYPAKVGRYPNRHALDFWEKRLGEAVRYPRELLQAIEANGFEPEAVETLDDSALAELYRGLESRIDGHPATASLREEVDLFRGASNKASVSYAFAIARRKEPGEKPPASRDRG